MKLPIRPLCLASFALILGSVLGCNGINRMGRNADMASERLATAKPVYEGRLTSVHTVGALTSLQFADGQLYDVARPSHPFMPGDIVRVYKTDKGFEAHLWRASTEAIVPPAPAPQTPAAPAKGRAPK